MQAPVQVAFGSCCLRYNSSNQTYHPIHRFIRHHVSVVISSLSASNQMEQLPLPMYEPMTSVLTFLERPLDVIKEISFMYIFPICY